MSLGFEQAGFDVVAALEADPAHAAVHRFNFPRCSVIEADAADVTGERLRRAVSEGLRRHRRDGDDSPVNVVFGGPPCQGFSVGGLLSPNDPRNRLVEQFVRLVIELRPGAFVLENVPAMASRALPGERVTVPEWLTHRMDRSGYEVAAPWTLNASRFGVPQDRRRLLIVGMRRPTALPSQPEPTVAPMPKHPGRPLRPGEAGHHQTGRSLPPGPTVGDALDGLPDVDLFEQLLHHDFVTLEGDHRERLMKTESVYGKALVRGAADKHDLSWPRQRTTSILTASLRTIHASNVAARFARTQPGGREAISRFVRLHPNGIAPTLRAGSTPDRGSFSAPRPIHPTFDRVISVREAARLQGFPDWFRFSAAKWHGFRQVGNSVCPPVARAVGEAVRSALELPGVKPTERLKLGKPTLLLVASGAGRIAGKSTFVPPADDTADAGTKQAA